jgi:hypothetical protein
MTIINYNLKNYNNYTKMTQPIEEKKIPVEEKPIEEEKEVRKPPTEVCGENKYVILQETSGDDHESWLTFIKIKGNEKNIKLLEDQLNSVYHNSIDDDDKEITIFDIETEHPVSETTAKEMSAVDLNHCFFHRKFDGVLKPIDFHLNKNEKDRKKIKKIWKVLGRGKIDEYVSDEDLDDAELTTDDDSSDEDSSDASGSSDDENIKEIAKKVDKIDKKPSALPSDKVAGGNSDVKEVLRAKREEERKERRQKQIKKLEKEKGDKEEVKDDKKEVKDDKKDKKEKPVKK